MRPDTALYQLRTMPQAFLENNLVLIAGLNTTPSGVLQYSFGPPANKMPPSGPGAPSEWFAFNAHSFQVEQPSTVPVHYLKMIAKTEDVDVANVPAYSLNGGPDIMVTGQLTKCTFCVGGTAALPVVAHIEPRPSPGLDSDHLRDSVRDNGQFAGGAGIIATFGYAEDYSPYATVVGVRSGGNWQFYGQVQSTLGAAARISAVTRIL